MQGPSDHTPGKGVEHDCQIHQFSLQTNVSDIGDPPLVGRCEFPSLRQIEEDFKRVSCICRGDELAFADGQQVVILPHSQDTFSVDDHATMTKLCRDPAVAVMAVMFDGHLLNGCTNGRLFRSGLLSLQPAIEASPAYLRQRTHPFHTQLAWCHAAGKAETQGSVSRFTAVKAETELSHCN